MRTLKSAAQFLCIGDTCQPDIHTPGVSRSETRGLTGAFPFFMVGAMFNPALDVKALAERYREKNRLQVRDLFVPELADRIFYCLTRETPWGVVYNEGDRVVRLSKDELRAVPQEERARSVDAAILRARTGFQFIYHAYPMVEVYLEGANKGFFLRDVFEAINSDTMLDFIRGVTGISTVIKADGQATLYAPGHFLTSHNDGADEKRHRRVAYVLSFTKDWHPDYGGLLQFYDERNDVTDVFVPRFNSLSIFTVPQFHAVSCVSPFAPLGRFAITGWFQDP
jgi:SM-20-related protein